MHNWMKKLEILKIKCQKEGKVGKYALVDVKHDDWCATYKGRECDCDPDVTFMPDVDEETWITAMSRSPRAD